MSSNKDILFKYLLNKEGEASKKRDKEVVKPPQPPVVIPPVVVPPKIDVPPPPKPQLPEYDPGRLDPTTTYVPPPSGVDYPPTQRPTKEPSEYTPSRATDRDPLPDPGAFIGTPYRPRPSTPPGVYDPQRVDDEDELPDPSTFVGTPYIPRPGLPTEREYKPGRIGIPESEKPPSPPRPTYFTNYNSTGPQTEPLHTFYATFHDVFDFFIDKRKTPLSDRFRGVVRGEQYPIDQKDPLYQNFSERVPTLFYNRLYYDEYSKNGIYMPLANTPDEWAGPFDDKDCFSGGYGEMNNNPPYKYKDGFKDSFFDYDKKLFETKTTSFKYDSDKAERELNAINNLVDKKDPYKIRIRNFADIVKAEFEMSYYGGVEKGKMVISLSPSNKVLLHQYKKLIEKGDRIVYTDNIRKALTKDPEPDQAGNIFPTVYNPDYGFTLVVENVNFITETLIEIELVGFRKWFEDTEVEKIMDFNELAIDTKGIERIVVVLNSIMSKVENDEVKEICISSFLSMEKDPNNPSATIFSKDNPISTIFSIVKNQNISAKKQEEFKKESIGDLLDNVCKTANVFLAMNNREVSLSWWWGGDRQIYISIAPTEKLVMGNDFVTLKSEVDDSKIINSYNFRGKVNIATTRKYIGLDGNPISINTSLPAFKQHVYMTQSFYFNFKIPTIWIRDNPPKDGEIIVNIFEEDFSKINYDDRLSQFLYGEHEEIFDIGEISLSKKGIVPNGTLDQVAYGDRFNIQFPGYVKKKWIGGVDPNEFETQGICPTFRPYADTIFPPRTPQLGAPSLGLGKGFGAAGYYVEKESQIRLQIETIILQHIYDRIKACRFILARNEHPTLKIELSGQRGIKNPSPHQAFITNVPNVVEYVNISIKGITGSKGTVAQSRWAPNYYYAEIPQCDIIEIFIEKYEGVPIPETGFIVSLVEIDKSTSPPTVKQSTKIPITPINSITDGGSSLVFHVSSVIPPSITREDVTPKTATPYSTNSYVKMDKYIIPNQMKPRKKIDLEINCVDQYVSPLYIKCITFNKTYPERQVVKRFMPDVLPNHHEYTSNKEKYGNINYINREIVNYVSNGLPCQKMKLKYTGINSFTSDSAKYAETPEQLLEDILIYNKIQPK